MTRIVKPVVRRGHSAVFHHRDTMRKRAAHHSASAVVPATTLPVDGTGNMSPELSLPMDGNDTYGDCGEAMAAHVDNILTFRQGKGTESVFDVNSLVSQYQTVSRGDNGLTEDMVVNQIWKVGIAGNKQAVIQDSLAVDVTNVSLAQYLIDQFYCICMAWSVPDEFLQTFTTGAVFTGTGVPDPNNGHFTPLTDVTAAGYYRVITWGTWGLMSPSYVASVDPQCFVVFTSRQFDPKTGLDSKGRHVSVQAQKWVALGGNATAAAAVMAMFPAAPSPGPSPDPIPTPTPSPSPTPSPTPVPPGPAPAPSEFTVTGTITSAGRLHGLTFSGTAVSGVQARTTTSGVVDWGSLFIDMSLLFVAIETRNVDDIFKIVQQTIEDVGIVTPSQITAIASDINGLVSAIKSGDVAGIEAGSQKVIADIESLVMAI